MGLGLGYGASKWPKIGIVIMGLSMGCLIGFMLYYAFMASSVNGTLAKILTVGGVALSTGIIYLLLFDQMIIVTSAVFGSYTLVRVSPKRHLLFPQLFFLLISLISNCDLLHE